MKGRTNAGGSSVQIPLDAPTALTALAGNAKVSLTWTDPKDKYATPEGSTSESAGIAVSVWRYTRVIRKAGSAPESPNDGVLVVESSVRNQYQTDPFLDTSVENDVTYYYAAYAYNEAYTASGGAIISVTPLAGYRIAELEEGTIITITENGAPVEFYLTKHNYEEDLNGPGKTYFFRVEPHSKRAMGGSFTWEQSDLISWMNGDYFNTLSEKTRELIGTTKYQVYARYGPLVEISSAVFPPSATELGSTLGVDVATEGELFPTYATVRLATYQGERAIYWTRSRVSSDGTDYRMVSIFGDSGNAYGSNRRDSDVYARPGFCLPDTAYVDATLALIES